ncbi:MAG: hypothetical protein AB2A00_14945 [Myxococcota bacterium]
MPEIRNPIQRFFWDNLTRGGLDLVDANRVDELINHVKQNKVTETEARPASAGEAQEIDTFEKGALKHLLDDNNWRNLLTDDGVKKLEQVLGIRSTTVRAGTGRDAVGEVPKGTVQGNFTRHIGTQNIKLEHTAALFNYEYNQRKAEFDNPRVPQEDRAKQLLFLLQDYAQVLNNAGSGPEVVSQRQELLKAFFDKPLAGVFGSKDPDDDLMSTAWEIVWGTDPERAQSSFNVDNSRSWTAYMSMNGEFVPMAKKLDELLAASGKPAKVEAFEKRSPLNWIVNEQTGNTKPSSYFNESTAIKSTGVDFAVKLLSNEGSVGNRTLDPSVDLKVDFYAWGNFVTLNKQAGEKLVALHDDTKQPLKVEMEAVGEHHWKPVFKDAAGAVVDPGKVTAVIQDRAGKVKGDGQATGSYSASWWGFCDRNAMQGLVTLKYGFPQPQKDVTLKVGDKEFTFSASEIRLMVGRRLTELFPETNQAGNRYDEEPDEIHLKDGSALAGKISSEVSFYRPETYRTGDTMVVTGDNAGAVKSSLLLDVGGQPREINVADIVEVRRSSVSGVGARAGVQDKLVLKDGSEVTGTLKSKLSFAKATREADGTMVLKNTEATPLSGDVKMTTTRGEEKRVSLQDIKYLVREDVNEILAEEALSYIIRNQGVFCADSWTASSVANGTRTIEEINRWKAGDVEKPDWIPQDLNTLEGYRGPVKNPENLMFFSLGNKGSSYGGLKFWIEVDENKMPINSKIISGQWDFLWGVEGKPNWDAPATFNPNVPNDLVLKLYVNSLENPEAIKDLLPENWRSHVLTPPQ